MDRLTQWNGKKWVLPQGVGTFRQIAERLAAYENTGLEPEEIQKAFVHPSNGDLIRGMTDAELASFIRLVEDGEIDYGLCFCSSCDHTQFDCSYCAIRWVHECTDNAFGLRQAGYLRKIKDDAEVCAKEAAEIDKRILKEQYEAFLKSKDSDVRPF